LGRLTWRRATVVALRDETATARTLTLEVDGWTGHRPGQHVDLRLTAPDGYSAIRPYSITTPDRASQIDITVERVADGEVSSYLVEDTAVGVAVDVRGPLGGWFVWDHQEDVPVQLVGGGVGVGPLMAMLREHDRAERVHPMRLLYSTRGPDTVLYAPELARRSADTDPASSVTLLFTRRAPGSATRPAGRISASDLSAYGLPPSGRTRCYVCGPTRFVEAGIDLLTSAGFSPQNIRAERFG
jgi:ferredoxin-NADP reductase